MKIGLKAPRLAQCQPKTDRISARRLRSLTRQPLSQPGDSLPDLGGVPGETHPDEPAPVDRVEVDARARARPRIRPGPGRRTTANRPSSAIRRHTCRKHRRPAPIDRDRFAEVPPVPLHDLPNSARHWRPIPNRRRMRRPRHVAKVPAGKWRSCPPTGRPSRTGRRGRAAIRCASRSSRSTSRSC